MMGEKSDRGNMIEAILIDGLLLLLLPPTITTTISTAVTVGRFYIVGSLDGCAFFIRA